MVVAQYLQSKLVPVGARPPPERRKSCKTSAASLDGDSPVKLSIKSELVYSFAEATQIIANIEGSHTSDQVILSEFLDIQPPKKIRSDKTPYGDRSIRASLSGKVTIRYVAEGENNLRQLLPRAGRQHLWSDLPSKNAGTNRCDL